MPSMVCLGLQRICTCLLIMFFGDPEIVRENFSSHNGERLFE